MARLLFRDSQGREGTVELLPSETVYVGRGLECAIRTDDGLVSRRHSQIRMESGRFVVEDLGSANGTHLNNVRVHKQVIGHADVIQCGSLVIRFLEDGEVNAGPPGMPGMVGGGGPAAPANLPYGGPPGMPGGAGPALPYGGPPNIPGESPSMFGPSGPGGGAPEAPRRRAADLGLELELELQNAEGEIRRLRAELDKSTAIYEREVADGQRVRAESAALRGRVEELRARIEDREDQVTAHERDREKLAQLEVELQETIDGKLAAESARNVARDALAKAEIARHKAAEAATDTAAIAERGLRSLQAEVDAAKTDAAKARAEAARARASADARAVSILHEAGSTVSNGDIAGIAGGVCEAITDILSEMRHHAVVVQGKLPNLSADIDTMQAVTDAIEALVDSAETAKGALRRLRDLAAKT